MLADALAGKELRTDQPLYRLLMVSLQQFTQTGNARPAMDLEVLSFTLLGSIASIIMLSYQHEGDVDVLARRFADRSDAHTSELQSLMRTSFAVFCLTKKNFVSDEMTNTLFTIKLMSP